MAAWVTQRGDVAGPLFVPITQVGEIVIRSMTDQAVYSILKTRATKANIKAFSPHDLRRSCVSDLLDAGVDISIVQQFVGHANVTTTARYDRRGEHAKKKAAKSLHVPFVNGQVKVSTGGHEKGPPRARFSAHSFPRDTSSSLTARSPRSRPPKRCSGTFSATPARRRRSAATRHDAEQKRRRGPARRTAKSPSTAVTTNRPHSAQANPVRGGPA